MGGVNLRGFADVVSLEEDDLGVCPTNRASGTLRGPLVTGTSWPNQETGAIGSGGRTAILPHAVAPRPLRKSLRRLCPVQINAHSACTFARPRRRNWRKPRARLMRPKTGSMIAFRRA